jgi:hypothetical protein
MEEKKTKVHNEDLFNALIVIDQKLNMLLEILTKVNTAVEEAQKEG